eukprot:2212382-Amphidinium_carterae.1
MCPQKGGYKATCVHKEHRSRLRCTLATFKGKGVRVPRPAATYQNCMLLWSENNLGTSPPNLIAGLGKLNHSVDPPSHSACEAGSLCSKVKWLQNARVAVWCNLATISDWMSPAAPLRVSTSDLLSVGPLAICHARVGLH